MLQAPFATMLSCLQTREELAVETLALRQHLAILILGEGAGGSDHGFLQVIELDPKSKIAEDLPSLTVTHDHAW
jgi:hypothetical protein